LRPRRFTANVETIHDFPHLIFSLVLEQGLLGIGICLDQSAINQLVATKEGVDAWPPESFDGIKIAISPNSTGHYVVQACLREFKFNITAIEYIDAQQDGVIEALEPGIETLSNGTNVTTPPSALYGGLWAPNTYTFLENNPGSQTLCSGATIYKTVTGGFMVREEFAKTRPDDVNKIMAAWLRGIAFVKNESNREEVFEHMEEFYTENGTSTVSLMRLLIAAVSPHVLFGCDRPQHVEKCHGRRHEAFGSF
jgi:ABC-type nitrate/sulfonate/bicarbonate transport system substrate-binding protein